MRIAFYVHHHGSGHLMRCLAIAAGLDECEITFLGSGLEKHKSLIPNSIEVIELPMDTPGKEDTNRVSSSLEGLHYAPLNISGQLQRVAIITHFLASHPRLLLIVDVSVEIAMLARLCGVPTVIVRQHGQRNDLPHHICYRNAAGLLAPYDGRMAGHEPKWIKQKTFYTGGFSRFSPREDLSDPGQRQVAVLIGSGGTTMKGAFFAKLSSQCPSWTFHVIGDTDTGNDFSNVHFHGRMDDPSAVLERCCIVIGNAGHNTVMECASLNKRFIAISEERPFKEQLQKAEIIESLSLAIHIPATQIAGTDWKSLLKKSLSTRPAWGGLVNPDSAKKAAVYLMDSYRKLFKKL
ncbi:glycosyltransferase [Pedobacter miscanthi]|uniref:Glycosyl transferase family 28 C-terminal domain-containing protein n=1 Tax=Pedobacter miscanthi TaxID=2259170 RepID=A0A366LDG4_9SPHI|nr:glycosyltransferase [Pedobacter miscanthi]RBQ11820.1 hypothetical protein DRW42_00650 [Pedobacter miscanthi]